MSNTVLNLIEAKKVCKSCKAEKSLGEFHRRSDGGLQTNCKPCRNKEYRNARGNDSDKRKTQVVTEHGRVCVDCKQEKIWSEFGKDANGFNQKTASCKSCRNSVGRDIYKNSEKTRRSGIKNRPDKLKRLYDVTYEQIVRVLDAQHGLCANRACGKEISLDVKGPVKNRAVIDHNHKTGKFRALLCTPCNMMLGIIEEKQNIMLGLGEYLSKYNH